MFIYTEKNIMSICNKEETEKYLKNPNIIIAPHPLNLKAGAIVTVSSGFELLQKVTNGATIGIQMRVGGNGGVPPLNIKTFEPILPHICVGSCYGENAYDLEDMFNMMKIINVNGTNINDWNLPLPAKEYIFTDGVFYVPNPFAYVFDIAVRFLKNSTDIHVKVQVRDGPQTVTAGNEMECKRQEIACMESTLDFDLE